MHFYRRFVVGLLGLLANMIFIPANAQGITHTTFYKQQLPSSKQQEQLNAAFKHYELYTIPIASINQRLAGKTTDFLPLKLGDRHDWMLELESNDLRSTNYQAFTLGGRGKEKFVPKPVYTYRGSVNGCTEKEARITLAEDFFYGYVPVGEEVYYMESLRRFDAKAAANVIVVYPKSAVKRNGKSCGWLEEQQQMEWIQTTLEKAGHQEAKTQQATCKTIDFAIAHDYTMYQKYGSMDALFAYTLGVMNNVEANFANNTFASNIRFQIVEQVAPICENCDAWSASTNAYHLLESFSTWSNNNNFSNDFDLAQFWTDRELDGSAVGMGYVGTACSSFRYHILQDFTANANMAMVTATHEIGHNLGANHNPTASGDIMDAALNNSSSWSSYAINAINNQLNQFLCFEDCGIPNCPSPQNLDVSLVNGTGLSVSWLGSGANSYIVSIHELESNAQVFSTTTAATALTLSPPMEYCKQYKVQVQTNCLGISTASSVYLETSFSSFIEIEDVKPVNCGGGTYDLNVAVKHQLPLNSNFTIWVNGVNYPQIRQGHSQVITVRGLPANSQGLAFVETMADINGTASCRDIATYKAPLDCRLEFFEDFNDGSLPKGWTNSNVRPSALGVESTWAFDDELRPKGNLPLGTVNGSPMAYFDDDLYMNIGGQMMLTSPAIDLLNYKDIQLTFSYDFLSFENLKPAPNDQNESRFSVEVWTGKFWDEVLDISHQDDCPWYSFWSCAPSTFSLNLDGYKNEYFKVRFVYDDGDKWAGAIGIDDVKIVGTLDCLRPEAISTTTSTLTADMECTDIDGWTHYWKSGKSDVLLFSIYKNNDPTLALEPSDVTIGVDVGKPLVSISNNTPYVNTTYPNGWQVLSRYWQVNLSPNEQPTGKIAVRFYYTALEKDALLSAGGGTALEEELNWFYFEKNANINPNPAFQHSAATTNDLVYTTPIIGNYAGHRYAEFTVTGFLGGGVGTSATTLPVSWTAFSGEEARGGVELKWTTETETDNAYFEIQRATQNGKFYPIGQVEGQGTTQESNAYSFRDKTPLVGDNYYRLKQVDLNGVSSFSWIINVEIKERVEQISLSPNPAYEQASLFIQANSTAILQVSIFSLTGQLIDHQEVSIREGNNQLPIHVSAYEKGMYFVRIQGEFLDTTLKLSVL